MNVEKTQLTICKDNYKTDSEFWSAVSKALQVATENEYEILFRYEDCGVYVLEYAHNHRIDDYGEDRFMLVTAEEQDDILCARTKASKLLED